MNKNAFFPELSKSYCYIFTFEIGDRLENDPKFRYAMQCRTQSVNTLPLLQRIKNKVLNLANYALTPGVAKSLG
jgi:hypothetical protein